MYLKSLTLKGFKSFADPTTLELEPGVTVVVGPNGSGKSNVVDAVAWVLGAQGPRVVRSAKMDDVIFAGTAKRPALGRAEVSLVIDNSAHELALDFNEVTITRTLFRSGESEYALNGVACRLLDVQELLSDSGVGRSQHVIIGQGQIDGILTARPEERRMVIEEAAGILKYRRRRERAVRRLESSEASLTRLQDLLREVRRQMRPLERQAASAHLHGELEVELTAIRRFLAGVELRTLETAVREGAASLRSLEERTTVLAASLEQVEAKLEAATDSLAREPDEDLAPQLSSLDRLHQRSTGLLTLIEERRRASAALLAALEAAGDVAPLEESRRRILTELEETEREAIALGPEWERLAVAETALIEAEVAHAERFVGLSRSAAPELAGRRAAADEARATLAERRQHELVARARAGELAERLALRRGRAASLADRQGELRTAAATLRSAAEAARQALERSAAERREGEERLSVAADARRRAQSREEALELALSEARERADLGRLGALPGLLGTLRELVVVDDATAPALEAALLGALDAAVLAEPRALGEALALLAGRGGVLLPLPDGPTPPAGPAPVGTRWLRELVDAEGAGLRALLDAQLRGVAITDLPAAEAFEAARGADDVVVVTRAGDVVARGAIRLCSSSVGATASAHAEARALSRAAAETESSVEEEVARLRALEHEAAAEEGRCRLAADAAGAELGGLDRELDSLGNELAELERAAQTAAAEEAARAAELVPAEAAAAAITRELVLLEAEAAQAAVHYEEADAARHLLDERARALAALRRDLEVRAAGLEGRREQLLRRREELDAALAQRREAVAEARQRRALFDAEEATLLGLAGELRPLAESLARRVAAVAAERDRRHALGREHLERLGSLRRERDDLERQSHDARERRQRSEIAIAEARIRHETALDALRRDLEIEPAEALAAPRPELAPGIEPAARLRMLERELRELGPVNPLAAEELASLTERSVFLEGQLEDVRRARRELNQVIRAVDAEIVDVFAAAYEDVAAHFESLFSMLFPGGEGRLSLTAPDDLLESGVEIEARPAGRNVRRLSLLSGGERSLVAMAYLFAVFRSRPSPFYLMDEVEAALDEVNLTRFHGLVDEFRGEAQLIIVSHQKKTMEIADSLYGISMQPGGGSKVLSERVSRAGGPRRALEPSGGWA